MRSVQFLALFIFVASGCSGMGGGGCACMQPLPDGFPSAERQANGAQVRLTDSGVAFLEANAGGLVTTLLGGNSVIAIPPACDSDLCCSDGSPDVCQVEIDMAQQGGDADRLEINPVDGQNAVTVVLRTRLRTLSDINVVYQGFSCDIGVNTRDAGNESVTLTAQLAFSQDATTGTTLVTVVPGSTQVSDLDKGDVHINGGIICDGADLFLKGLVIDTLTSTLEGQVQTTLSNQLCKKCTEDSMCMPFGTCDQTTGQCMETGTDHCLQVLGTTGRMAAAQLVGSLNEAATSSLDLYMVSGGYTRAEGNGLSSGMLTGFLTADGQHDSCVPVAAAPPPATIAESTALTGNTRPDGMPFHLGIGLHERALDRLLYAAYDSGALCLNVGSNTVSLLKASTLGLLVPSLPDLLHGADEGVFLALRPQAPPTFVIGDGTFKEDGSIDQPLLTLGFIGLEIDFYARVDERLVRIFTLKTDLQLPISLDGDETGAIQPVLGDINGAFTNLSVTNSDLLTETQQDIADKFPAILGALGPLLGNALGPIAPPALAGLAITVDRGSFAPLEAKSILGLFLTLAPAPAAAAKMAATRVDTVASIRSMRVPPTEVFSRPGKLQAADRPTIDLELGAIDARGSALGVPHEWSWREGDGAWSAWSNDARPSISRDDFWLQGKHLIQVRSRLANQPLTTDPSPVSLVARIDTVAPTIELGLVAPGVVSVDATDMVSDSEDLVARWRVEGGAWQDLGPPPAELALPEGARLATLEVTVSDENGNVGVASGTVLEFHGREPAGSGCGCAVGGGSSTSMGNLWLVLVLIGGGLLLRLRRQRAALLAAVIAGGALAGCGGGASGPPSCSAEAGLPTGALGRYLDMDADDKRTVAVGYEDKYGDLVFADVKSACPRWQPVDGVPEGGAVVDEPDGYRGGVDAPGDDVGPYAQVTLFGGKARVAYQSVTVRSELFASEGADGKFTRHVVDLPAAGTAGFYTSMAQDVDGTLGIAYMVTNIPNGAGGFSAELRFAQSTTPNPASTGDWAITKIAIAPIKCTGLCVTAEAPLCVISTEACTAEDMTCAATCAKGTGCVGGTCVPVEDVPGAPGLPEGPGLFASAGYLPNGVPVVAYYDRTGGDLHLASSTTGSSWDDVDLTAPELTEDPPGLPSGDDGQWTSMAIASDGTVHIAYQDALHDRLMHVTWKDGVATLPEVVDDGLRTGDRPHPVGGGAHLFFDKDGAIGILYQDEATSDLLLARQGSGGTWTHSVYLEGAIGYGFYNAHANQGRTTWIGTYGYERDKFPPGEVYLQKLD
jgi:MYXO-CTERM domain-containing protein